MALQGSLRDFTLADVLQLIGLSRKTGLLRVRRADGATGGIWFRNGEVFFAQSNWERAKLGERLIAAQKITPGALDRALQIHASDPAGRRIGQILVEERYITEPLLETFVQEQIQDTIFDLMRWEDGEFGFELLPEVIDEDIGLSVSIENIAIEASRRMEEWERIKSKIPSMEVVFRMSASPGESGFEISLKPAEWNILLLVDGSRNVSDLARATGQTDFEVARIAYGLFSAGLLEAMDDNEAQKSRTARLSREAEATLAGDVAQPQTPVGSSIQPNLASPAGEAPRLTPTPAEDAEPLPDAARDETETMPPREQVGVLESGAGETPPTDSSVTGAPEEEATLDDMLGALPERPEPTEPQPSAGTKTSVAGATEVPEEPAPAEGSLAGRGVEVVVEEYLYERGEDAATPTDMRISIEPLSVMPSVPATEEALTSTREAEPVGEEVAEEAEEDENREAELEQGSDLPEPPRAEPAVEEVLGVAEPMSSVPTREIRSVSRSDIDIGLGGTISDEIAALTGAGRSMRSAANVERSPGLAGAALQRDTRVDRDTVSRIISAIENL